ncbi:MAG TPA: hypothetical protein VLJ86_06215 [Ramlibacter sp.]|nr:hypothetical protein [Ramlibacter sp.]
MPSRQPLRAPHLQAPQGAAPRDTTQARRDGDADAQMLAQACKALWTATLGLMAAYIQQRDLPQRRALARRIANNFAMLETHSGAFAPRCRESFARLALRWSRAADPAAEPTDARVGRPLSLRH